MPGGVTVGIKGGLAHFTRQMGPNSALARSLDKQAAASLLPGLEATAEDARQRAEDYAAKNYQRRSGDRKNTRIDQTPLHGSMRARVVSVNREGGMPARIELWSEADPRKVHSLNSGAKAHEISARDAPMLVFPATTSRFRPRGAGLGARQGTTRVARTRRFRTAGGAGAANARSGGPLVKKQSVQHPGIKPSYFMELAVEGAVNAKLRKQVRLTRH